MEDLLQMIKRSQVMGRFKLSGRGKDPVKTCCGRAKHVVLGRIEDLIRSSTWQKRIVIVAKS
jgi:long-subunit acyl-CoA synthetase (AMP-forming)